MKDTKLSDLKTTGVIFGPKLGILDSYIVFHNGKFRNFELTGKGPQSSLECEFGHQVFTLIAEMKREADNGGDKGAP